MVDSEKELAKRLQKSYVRFCGEKYAIENPIKIQRVVFASKEIDKKKDPHKFQYITQKTLYIKKELFFDKDLLNALLWRWIIIHILYGKNGFSETIAEIANSVVAALLMKKNIRGYKKWIKLCENVSKEYKDEERKKIIYPVKFFPKIFERNTFQKLIEIKGFLPYVTNRIESTAGQLDIIYSLMNRVLFSELSKKQFEYLKAIILYQEDNQHKLSKILGKQESTINPQIKFLRDNFYYIRKTDVNYLRIGLANYTIIYSTPKAWGTRALPMDHPFLKRKKIISNFLDFIFLQFLVPVKRCSNSFIIEKNAEREIQLFLDRIKSYLTNNDQEFILIETFLEDQSNTLKFQNIDLWDFEAKDWKNPFYQYVDENQVEERKIPSFKEYSSKQNIIDKEDLDYINEITKLNRPTNEEIRKKKNWSNRKINKIKEKVRVLELVKDIYMLTPRPNFVLLLGFMELSNNNELEKVKEIVAKMYYGSIIRELRSNEKILLMVALPSKFLQKAIYWLNFIFNNKIRLFTITEDMSASSFLPSDYFIEKKWIFPKIKINQLDTSI